MIFAAPNDAVATVRSRGPQGYFVMDPISDETLTRNVTSFLVFDFLKNRVHGVKFGVEHCAGVDASIVKKL